MPSGGGGSAPATTTNTVQTTVPDWLQGPIMQNINTATAQAAAPYVDYQGQRIAPLNATQNQAANLTQSGIGQYNPTLQQGITATNAAALPFSQDTFNQYNDPYKSQVTDEIARLGNQNFNNVLMPGINSQFTGNGMFGSSRNAKELGLAAENTQKDITGQQAQYLSSGFQNSMNNMNTGLARQASAGAQLGNLAGAGQAMNAQDVAALQATGGQQQQSQQQLLDTAYNTFLQQQQYPEAQQAYLSAIIHGSTPSGVVSATTQNIANPTAQAVGLAGTLTQALNSGGSKTGYSKGGKVKAMRAKSTGKKKAGMPMGLGSMAYG